MLATRPCQAQATPPSDADRAQARIHFHSGVDAYTRGEFAAALDEFRTAYRLAPHPSVLGNIANCYQQLHQPAEALSNFEQYLAESTNVPPAQRREVDAQIRQLQQQVAEVRLRITPESASGVTITVDGHSVARAETLRVSPGRHSLEVSASGFETEHNDIETSAGTRADVWVRLRPPGSPAVAAVTTPTPPAPSSGAPAEPGGSAAPPAAGSASTTASAEPAGSAAPPGGAGSAGAGSSGVDGIPRDDTHHGLAPGLFYASVAVTGVAAVSWVVFGSMALSANGTFNNAAMNIQNGVGNYETERMRGASAASFARTTAIVSDVSLVVTVLGAATSVIVFTQTDFGRRGTTVTPTASADGAGLAVLGSF